MEKMRANIFHGKTDIRVEEVERPRVSVERCRDTHHSYYHLRHYLHIVRGEIGLFRSQRV